MYFLLDISVLDARGNILDNLLLTNAPRPISVYKPAPFRVRYIENKAVKAKIEIEFSLASKNVANLLLKNDTPFINVKISTLSPDGKASLEFAGVVTSLSLTSDKLVVQVSTYDVLFDSTLPVAYFQLTCNWAFGSRECGLREEDYTIIIPAGHYNTIGDTLIQVDEGFYPSGLRAGHIVKKGVEIRTIISVSDTSREFQISSAFSDNRNEDLKIVKCCNKTLDDCLLYNNIANFSGFPFPTLRNPSFFPVDEN